MKRNQFLKSLGIGALALAVAPTIIKAEESVHEEKRPSVAIDLLSISGITVGGSVITPAEIMQIWRQTGVLVYKSHDGRGHSFNPPIVIKGELKAVDITKEK